MGFALFWLEYQLGHGLVRYSGHLVKSQALKKLKAKNGKWLFKSIIVISTVTHVKVRKGLEKSKKTPMKTDAAIGNSELLQQLPLPNARVGL